MVKSAVGRPKVFFTVEGQERSLCVLRQLERWVSNNPRFPSAKIGFRVLAEGQVAEFFRRAGYVGIRPELSVVLFDSHLYRKHFQFYDFRLGSAVRPTWACGSSWGVAIGEAAMRGTSYPLNVTAQTAANFLTRFDDSMARGELPWGPKRAAKEHSARRIRRSDCVMMF